MSLFSKLKDYNMELDKVLDSKYFSSNIKNLLLSMIYKLEVSYVDYKEIKRCVRNKEDFLNEIIEIIRLYCDNIKTVEPDSDQAKLLIKNNVMALTNEKERSILCYPIELSLFYAISDISPKYFYINQDFVLKDVFQSILVNGYNLNSVEILRDFNGWSWDQTYDEEFDYIDNLIYQNLLIILGEKFLYEWRTYNSTKRDFILEAKEFIKYFTGNYNYLQCLYKMIYLKPGIREIVGPKIKENKKLLKKMDDKAKFIEEAKNKKQKIINKLEKIEKILNDSKLLEKEFRKLNSKLDKKIKTIKKYKEKLIKEKEICLKQINEIDFILKPKNYLVKKEYLQKASFLYACKGTFYEALVNCQKQFLLFIDKKVNKINTRDELIDIIYEIRYYKSLKISKEVSIYEIDELRKYIDKIMKKVITKLCKIGAMKIISMDINLNFEIINYALDSKIIQLEEIRLFFDIDDDNSLIIKVFDKDAIEKQGRKQIDITHKILDVKLKRKIKLFN